MSKLPFAASNPSATISGTVAVNLVQQEGVNLSAPIADAPVGTETTSVTRDIFRKRQILLTTTPLAGNGVFTGPWIDTEITGTNYVSVLSISNTAPVNNGCQLQESEDQVAANSFLIGAIGNTNICRIAGIVRQRYYRVVYTNGVGAQASFSLYATEMSLPFGTSPFVNGAATDLQVIGTQSTTAGIAVDAVVTQCISAISNQALTGGVQQNDILKFNGNTFDRNRNNFQFTGDNVTQTATFNGITQTNYEGHGGFLAIILGTVSGTTPTLSVQLQISPDNGTTWFNLGPASANLTATGQTLIVGIFPCNWSSTPGATPANLTTGATQTVLINAPLPRTFRFVYTIGGTTPSFVITNQNVLSKA